MQLSTTFVILAPERILQECENKHEALEFSHQAYYHTDEAKKASYLVIETEDVADKTVMHEIVKNMRKFVNDISADAELVYATKIKSDAYTAIDTQYKQQQVLGVNVFDPSQKVFSDYYIDVKVCNPSIDGTTLAEQFDYNSKPLRVGVGHYKNYISKKNLQKLLSSNLSHSIQKLTAVARKEGNFIEIVNTAQLDRKRNLAR